MFLAIVDSFCIAVICGVNIQKIIWKSNALIRNQTCGNANAYVCTAVDEVKSDGDGATVNNAVKTAADALGIDDITMVKVNPEQLKKVVNNSAGHGKSSSREMTSDEKNSRRL